MGQTNERKENKVSALDQVFTKKRRMSTCLEVELDESPLSTQAIKIKNLNLTPTMPNTVKHINNSKISKPNNKANYTKNFK